MKKTRGKARAASAKLEIDEVRDTASKHPADQELRRRGFKIYARPRSGPVLWEKDGVLYVQLDRESIALEPA